MKVQLWDLNIGESLVFDEHEEELYVNTSCSMELSALGDFEGKLVYSLKKGWCFEVSSYSYRASKHFRSPKFYRTRKDEINQLILNSTEFKAKKDMFEQIIKEKTAKTELPKYEITSQIVDDKDGIVWVYFKTPDISDGWIRFDFDKQKGGWKIQYLAFPKAYLGFTEDFGEIIKEEVKLLLSLSEV